MGSDVNPKTYEGVKMSDLAEMEEQLEIAIYVYQLVEDEESGEVHAELVRGSPYTYSSRMSLDLYKDHFSYITSLSLYAKSYCCRKCGKLWEHAWACNRHELTCEASTKRKFVGGTYHPTASVFELMEEDGIVVPEHLRYYRHRATFDFEVYFEKEDLPAASGKQTWKAKHVPLSWSACSNVPGCTSPVCHVTDGDAEKLVKELVDYLHSVQEQAEELTMAEHRSYLTRLQTLIERKQELEAPEPREDLDSSEVEEETESQRRHPLELVKEMYEAWIQEMPVIGFNSGRYDLNVIKPHLMKALGGEMEFVVKRSSTYMCLKTERLKFVDILNYLAPGVSYASYLKA